MASATVAYEPRKNNTSQQFSVSAATLQLTNNRNHSGLSSSRSRDGVKFGPLGNQTLGQCPVATARGRKKILTRSCLFLNKFLPPEKKYKLPAQWAWKVWYTLSRSFSVSCSYFGPQQRQQHLFPSNPCCALLSAVCVWRWTRDTEKLSLVVNG